MSGDAKETKSGLGSDRAGYEKWAWRIAVLAVFAAALAWRWHFAAKSQIYTYDSYYYLVLARNLRHGLDYAVAGHAHFKFLPLYPLSITFLNLFIPNLETAGKLSNVIFSAACVFPIFAIGKLIFGRRSGLIAAALFAFEPISVAWSSVPMSEGLFTLLTCLSALFFLLWMKGCRRRDLYLAAGAAGLSMVTRWEGVFLVLFQCLFLFFYWYRGRVRTEHLLIAGAILLVPPGLFALRNLIVFGTPFKSAYVTEARNYLPQLEMFTMGERLRRYFIFTDLNPLGISTRSYHWGYLLFGYGGMAFILFLRRFRPYALFLWAWLIFMGPLHFIWYFASVRFLIPAVPALCLGAGALLGMPLEKLERRRLPATIGAIILVLAFCMVAVLAVTSRPVTNDFFKRNIISLEDDVGGLAAKDALLWLKEEGGEGEVVTNLGAEASFYLGRDALFLGDWQQFEPADVKPHLFLEEAREKNVRYVVIHSERRDLEEAMRIAGLDYDLLDQLDLVGVWYSPPTSSGNTGNHAFVLEVPRDGD